MIKTTGHKLKVKLADVTRAIKEAVVTGAEQAKQIYNRALAFLLNDVKNVKCEDLIDSAVIKQRFHSPVNGTFTVCIQETLTCSMSTTRKVDRRAKCVQKL